MFRSFWKLIGISAVAAVSAVSPASASIYTTEASFLAAIQPGSYLNDFNGYKGAYNFLGGIQSFTDGSGKSYDFTAPAGGLYAVSPTQTGLDGAISTLNSGDPLTATFTGSSAITAVGGFFFSTADNGDFIASTVTVTLDNGTTVSIPQNNPTLDFLGFTSTVPILSITTTSGDPSAFPTVDHFYAASAVATVPEPASLVIWSLLGSLAIGLGWYRQRKSRIC